MEKPDLGWVAGIIDGEGCITIARTKSGGRFHYSLRVQVDNTESELVFPLAAFGGSAKAHIRIYRPRRRLLYNWTIQSRQARDFLVTIMPYLHSERKKAAGKIGIKFQSQKTYGRVNRTFEYTQQQERAWLHIRKLNTPGGT